MVDPATGTVAIDRRERRSRPRPGAGSDPGQARPDAGLAVHLLPGAARIMAEDLKSTPRAGLGVQLCGDGHLSNFDELAITRAVGDIVTTRTDAYCASLRPDMRLLLGGRRGDDAARPAHARGGLRVDTGQGTRRSSPPRNERQAGWAKRPVRRRHQVAIKTLSTSVPRLSTVVDTRPRAANIA